MPVRVISVTSGKGGVGKSHLAVNVATLCARAGQRVLVFDADGGLSNVDVLLGAKPARHVGDLLDGAALDAVLHQVSSHLWLLAGAPGERRLAHLEDHARRVLTSVWAEVADRFDVVVVDVGAGVGDDVLFFASAGQNALVVITDEPTSLADAVVLVQALAAKTPVREVDVVVNCVRTERSAQVVFARLQQAAGHCLRLRFASNIPDDQNVRRAAMAGKPLVELAPTSPASRAFERLTQALLAAPPRRPTGGVWLTESQLSSEHRS